MNIELELNIMILGSIAIISAFVAWEFYKSRNGRLRILIIRLFCTKIWVYGGAAILVSLGHEVGAIQRLILNIPMMIVMLQLWKFIRTRE